MDDKLVRLSDVRLIESNPNAYPEDWNEYYEQGFVDAINAVLDIPAVDAVEVVRCRECAFWGLEPKEGRAEAMCLDLMRTTASGFYCAHGQRREDGDA